MKIKRTPKNEIRRLTLRGWAAIDDLSRSIESAAREGEWLRVAELMFQVIEIGCKKFDRNTFWMDTVEIYNQILQSNQPTKKFPILTSKTKTKPLPWEYEGRSWYFWLHTLGKEYGWSADKIGDLDIDDAIGLYQEIIIGKQLKEEWEWGLSELSYEYNKSTKKSHFKPLPRPDWMKPVLGKPQPVRKTRFPVAMMPAGLVVNLDEETEPPKNAPV